MTAIVAETGARIVVSSSWRFEDGCRRRLLDAGIPDAFHEDWGHRPDGLRAAPPRPGDPGMAHLHPEVTRYVILDDETAMLPEQMRHLVHVDSASASSTSTASWRRRC